MTSRTAFNAVIYVIGAALLLSIGGVIFLSATGHPVDDLLKQTAIGCLTGLGALLARTPSGDEPQPVVIADEPVEVTDTGKKAK